MTELGRRRELAALSKVELIDIIMFLEGPHEEAREHLRSWRAEERR